LARLTTTRDSLVKAILDHSVCAKLRLTDKQTSGCPFVCFSARWSLTVWLMRLPGTAGARLRGWEWTAKRRLRRSRPRMHRGSTTPVGVDEDFSTMDCVSHSSSATSTTTLSSSHRQHHQPSATSSEKLSNAACCRCYNRIVHYNWNKRTVLDWPNIFPSIYLCLQSHSVTARKNAAII